MFRKRLTTVGILVGIVCAMTLFLILVHDKGTYIVYGNSMEPTLKQNQLIFTKKEKTYQTQDIVVFHLPINWNKYTTHQPEGTLVKRIIAKEGDTITVTPKELKVNDVVLLNYTEYYQIALVEDYTLTLENGEYFVLGDNNRNSFDSLSMLLHTKTDEFKQKHFLIFNRNILGRVLND